MKGAKTRADALEREAAAYDAVADEARASEQYTAAVAAMAKAAGARAEAASLRELAAARAERDPIKRLEADLERARAAGSHVAVATMFRVLEAARKERAAAEAKREEESRRAMPMTEKLRRLREAILALPPRLRDELVNGLRAEATSSVH